MSKEILYPQIQGVIGKRILWCWCAATAGGELAPRHLRPPIANYIGSVDVLVIDDEDCLVRYDRIESIDNDIKAAIMEKFPIISSKQ
jgi:hypothetical protein